MRKNRGYSMPLLTDRKTAKQGLIILPAIFILMLAIEYKDLAPNGTSDTLALNFLIIMLTVFSILYLGTVVRYFAQLHMVPEGVAVTAFGLTLRRIPAEQIRLITAAHAVYKGKSIDKIVLCDYTLEELTERAYRSKPKMFRNSREFRVGEWANDYLTRILIHGSIPYRRIYLICWESERLQALRSLYPHAQWMDLTKDKYFDKQLKTEVNL